MSTSNSILRVGYLFKQNQQYVTRLPSVIFLRHRAINTNSCLFKTADVSDDPETHTGQKFEKDDYRLTRFIGKEKQINERFAIDLIAETPPTEQHSRVVSCDGGGGPTGHPKVYINLDSPGNHSCGYCGLRFYKEDHHH